MQKKRHKIIYAVNIPFPFIAARSIQIVNTCYSLAKKGNDVLLLFGGFANANNNIILKKFFGLRKSNHLKIIKIPSLIADKTKKLRLSYNGIYLFSSLFFLIFLRFFNKHDVLFLREIKTAVFFIRFKWIIGLPVIFEAHDIFHIAEEDAAKRNGCLNKKNKLKILKIKHLEEYIFKNADAIITVNGITKRMIIEQFNPRFKVYTVPNGVTLEEQKQINKLNGENDYICYIGHLYKWKGVDVLVSAMKDIDTKLLIIGGKGDDKDLKRLNNLALGLGVLEKIEFTGFVEPKRVNFYRDNATVLILPNTDILYNRCFTSPIKLFEYMSSKRPIVASNLPAISEVLTHMKNSILFEPDNPKSLASCVNLLLNDVSLSDKISRTAYNDVKKYTWDIRGERIEEVIAEIKKG